MMKSVLVLLLLGALALPAMASTLVEKAEMAKAVAIHFVRVEFNAAATIDEVGADLQGNPLVTGRFTGTVYGTTGNMVFSSTTFFVREAPESFRMRIRYNDQILFDRDGLSYVQYANQNPGPVPTPSGIRIGTASLPAGKVGDFYRAALQASGGTAPYRWALAAGTQLPYGLVLTGYGEILGYPRDRFSGYVGVVVLDNLNLQATTTLALNIADNVAPPPPPSPPPPPPVVNPLRADNSYLPSGRVNDSYRAQLTASGGVPPYQWALTGYGALPSGLTLYASGEITGYPRTTFSGTLEFMVTDSQYASVRDTVSLTIVDNTPPVQIGTYSLPNAREDSYYRTSLYASGGNGSYSWSLVGGRFPWGLSLTSSGEIYGTPRDWGSYSFEVEVRDGYGKYDRRSFSIYVERRYYPPPPRPYPYPYPPYPDPGPCPPPRPHPYPGPGPRPHPQPYPQPHPQPHPQPGPGPCPY